MKQTVINHVPEPLRRIARYGFAGLAVSVFYSLLVAVLCVWSPLRISPTLASVAAFFATLPVGWFAHSCWSFGDRQFERSQPVRFLVTNSVSFVTAVSGMYWITEIAGCSWLFGIAWNWAFIPVANYMIYLFWVFRDRPVSGRSRRVCGEIPSL
jgi:putative flippase GtrA